jgi:hypothetical protein
MGWAAFCKVFEHPGSNQPNQPEIERAQNSLKIVVARNHPAAIVRARLQSKAGSF